MCVDSFARNTKKKNQHTNNRRTKCKSWKKEKKKIMLKSMYITKIKWIYKNTCKRNMEHERKMTKLKKVPPALFNIIPLFDMQGSSQLCICTHCTNMHIYLLYTYIYPFKVTIRSMARNAFTLGRKGARREHFNVIRKVHNLTIDLMDTGWYIFILVELLWWWEKHNQYNEVLL